MNSRWFLVLFLTVSIISLPACVYRVDIPQGNRISDEKIAQLEVGMTKRQVEFLLGEPAVRDIYHPDIWHYVYYLKSGDDSSVEKRIMVLSFDGDKLSLIEGTLSQNQS